MKKLTAMMITAAALAVSAFAQAPEALELHLAMPATVSGVVLAAGDYTIRATDGSGNIVLSIRSTTTKTHVLALANPINDANTLAAADRVTLVRDGDTYRIDKVWIGYTGYEILHRATK